MTHAHPRARTAKAAKKKKKRMVWKNGHMVEEDIPESELPPQFRQQILRRLAVIGAQAAELQEELANESD